MTQDRKKHYDKYEQKPQEIQTYHEYMTIFRTLDCGWGWIVQIGPHQYHSNWRTDDVYSLKDLLGRVDSGQVSYQPYHCAGMFQKEECSSDFSPLLFTNKYYYPSFNLKNTQLLNIIKSYINEQIQRFREIRQNFDTKRERINLQPLFIWENQRMKNYEQFYNNLPSTLGSHRQIIQMPCCNDNPVYPDPYKFNFNGRDVTTENQNLFDSNYVRTSKYTLLTFFPKALILQFYRAANVYFLVIAILQSITVISPLDPFTAWFPLIFVLLISMIRQGYQDFQRIKSDRRTNYETKTKVMRNGKLEQINWSQVVTGDIVYVEADEMFPADLILISSSNQGSAFIETASLDGQKNLKPRNGFKDLFQYNSESALSNLKGTFEGNQPDMELHKFSAKIIIDGNVIPIQGDKQLLYRGTFLKNTKWIYGLAILTGRNTKIVMNSKSSAIKMSQIQVKVNKILLYILGAQFILCFVCALLYSIFRRNNQHKLDYIDWPDEYIIPLDSFFIFLSYFVLLNTMIPISLIVSIEMVKFAQKIFIEKDHLLFSQFRKKGVSVKSASLNEQLGQIQYVFSDKTGTLTMNLMEFKIAVIAEQMYGDISLIAPEKNKKNKSEQSNHKGFYDEKLKKLVGNGENNENLRMPLRITDASGGNQIVFNNKKEIAEEYLQALSLAHEVVADKNKKGQKIYQGPSPDEITLVDAAKQMNFQFMKATQSTSTIEIQGKQKKFQLLQTFAFTSDRKRMSVVVRDPNGAIKVYMKGADSIVLQRLSKNNQLNLNEYLNQFSRIGLRTLLIAMKTMSESQYAQFKKAVQNLPPQNKQEPYNQLIDKLQQDMHIIGATAVLDRLQDEVPQTIRDLIRANIKVWMLTGDKMQTAENIAKSCNLIQPNFEILRYQPNNEDLTKQGAVQILKSMVKESRQLYEDGIPKGLLIEGSDLTLILKHQQTQKQLANLAQNCQAVVCCRLLPSQKADVVRVVRKYLNKITLSIGDGANDIPMIKQAHIGIGLHGEEGMGAVQACDYALPQFRMLWRVLLVHGRWNYIRISEMILYFFYKNMLFTLPQFYLAFYVGYSAQTIFDDWYVSLYNLAFTSIPLVVRAIFQQDVNYIYKQPEKKKKNRGNENGETEKKMEQEMQPQKTLHTLIQQQKYLPENYRTNKYFYRLFPKIYFIGQQNCIFNMKNYGMWMLQALIQSIIITFFTIYIISEVSVNSTGINSDYWLVSLTIYSTVILVVTFKLITHTKFWSWLLVISIIVTTFLFYCLHMWLSNFALTDNVKGTTLVAWTSLQCYLVVLLCVCIILFVDGVIVFLDFSRGGYASKMREIMREHKINNRAYYDALSLSITQKLTKSQDLQSRKSRKHGRSNIN